MPTELTSSRFELAAICAASCALPVVHEAYTEETRRGDAVHKYAEIALMDGEEAADAAVEAMIASDPMVPADLVRFLCQRVDLRKISGESTVLEVEVAYSYHTERGTATILGSQTNRGYGKPLPEEICGTADVVRLAPDGMLVVGEIKTFDDGIPALDHYQLALHCLALARAYKRDTVVGELIRITKDGTHIERATFDADVLSVWAARARTASRRVRQVRADVVMLIPVDVTAGQHCRRCKAMLAGCPAFTALPAAMAREAALPGDPVVRLAGLTAEEFGRAYEQLTMLERMAESVREVMRLEASVRRKRGEVIPLANGMQLDITDQRYETLKFEDSFAVLADEYGEDTADRCTKKEISKSSIEATLGNTEAEKAFKMLRAMGAIRRSTKPKFQPRKMEVLPLDPSNDRATLHEPQIDDPV